MLLACAIRIGNGDLKQTLGGSTSRGKYPRSLLRSLLRERQIQSRPRLEPEAVRPEHLQCLAGSTDASVIDKRAVPNRDVAHSLESRVLLEQPVEL